MNVRYIGSGYLVILKIVVRLRVIVCVEKRVFDIFVILEIKLFKSKCLLVLYV